MFDLRVQRILTSSLADPSFKITGIRYLNITLEYVYLGALGAFQAHSHPPSRSIRAHYLTCRSEYDPVCCFLLALGNRPQGSRGMYILIMSLYALMTVYMLVSLTPRPQIFFVSYD